MARIRCTNSEQELWRSASGGERKFSEWARNLLNLGCNNVATKSLTQANIVATTDTEDDFKDSHVEYEEGYKAKKRP